MGVNVEWDNDEQTILRYTVLGDWTWEEFYAARSDARRMADAVAYPQVYTIIDIHAGSLFPANALSHFRRLPEGAHPKFKAGLVVIIESSLFVRSLIKIMRQLNPAAMQSFYSARTLEEARALLLAHMTIRE